MHHLDDPLASPWSTARSICLWVKTTAWVVLFINLLTTKIDWVFDAALTTAVLALLALVPVQIIGSMKFKRESETAEQLAKEADRLRHLGR